MQQLARRGRLSAYDAREHFECGRNVSLLTGTDCAFGIERLRGFSPANNPLKRRIQSRTKTQFVTVHGILSLPGGLRWRLDSHLCPARCRTLAFS
jgi:hypothetical protein